MFSRKRFAMLVATASACLPMLIACGSDAQANEDVAAAPHYAVAPDAKTAQGLSQQDPTQSPPGTNIWTCRLSAAHPRPLILVPGTFATMELDFGALGPMLANAGYCVFTLNYGYQADTGNYATGPIAASGTQLAAFVSQVLSATGADKVDLLGHSEGGVLVEYYLKSLGGAATAANFVGLSPITHGTTLQGVTVLAQIFPPINILVDIYCPACVDEEAGSAFIEKLDGGHIAQSGVHYTIIETQNETVVTPVGSSFIDEPGVNDFYVQSQCPADDVDHGDLSYDAVVFQDVLNALNPSRAAAPDCAAAYPVPTH